jgi:hypothetical protein
MTKKDKKERQEYIDSITNHVNHLNMVLAFSLINQKVENREIKTLEENIEFAVEKYHKNIFHNDDHERVHQVLQILFVEAKKYLNKNKKFIDQCAKEFKDRLTVLDIQVIDIRGMDEASA